MADYNRLAQLMGMHQELAIFRQFADLNAKNLLFMQSELIHLEAELSAIELENKHSGNSQKASFHVSVFELKESEGSAMDLQWRKTLEVRTKLAEYSVSPSTVSSYSMAICNPPGLQTKLFCKPRMSRDSRDQAKGMSSFFRSGSTELTEATSSSEAEKRKCGTMPTTLYP